MPTDELTGSVVPADRRGRERERRRREFLEAAERLFAEHGYARTSIEDIARAAGFATGTVYRYFESKEALYRELVDEKAARHMLWMREEPTRWRGCAARLVEMLRHEMAFVREHREFLRVFVAEVARPAGSLVDAGGGECRKLRDEYCGMIRKVLEEGVERGEVGPMDTEMMAVLISGLGELFFVEVVSRRDGDGEVDRVEGFLIQLVERMLKR